MGLTIGGSKQVTAPKGSLADPTRINARNAANDNSDNIDNSDKILGLDKKTFYIVAGSTLLVAGVTTFLIIRKKRKNK